MDLVSAAYETSISLNRPNHRDTDFYSGFNLAWSKHQMEDLDLDSTGVNWFPLAYTHIASGPSASSSRGMRGLPL